MRRINDPMVLRDCLFRLSSSSNLTVAQARLLAQKALIGGEDVWLRFRS